MNLGRRALLVVLTLAAGSAAADPVLPCIWDFEIDYDSLGTHWRADYNTTIICFRWENIAGAEYYQLFVKNNGAYPDYVKVRDHIQQIDWLVWQCASVDLATPPIFDIYSGDTTATGEPLVTPFADGTEINFVVRAANQAGVGPFSPPITIADESAPAFGLEQLTSADNSDEATTAELVVRLHNLSDGPMEFLDTIMTQFVETEPGSTFLPSGDDVEWQWPADRIQATASIALPAGGSAVGLSVIVGLRDGSSNESADTVLLVEDVGLSVDDNRPRVPLTFSLAQNHPNPFNAMTSIAYDLPVAVHVRIEVFNVLGRRAATLVDSDQPAGHHRVIWDGTNRLGKTVSSGVYFYKIEAGDFTTTKKMLLLK